MKSLPLLVSLPDNDESIRILARELGWADDQLEAAQHFYSLRLPPLLDTEALPFLFGVSPRLITHMRWRPKHYYRHFRLGKRGGSYRTIWAPRRFTKLIQRWLLTHIVQQFELPACATAFHPGASIFRNAQEHLNGTNLLVVDVRNFFESVRIDSVRSLYAEFGYPQDVCLQLAELCTLDGHLPQGAPTSPWLANAAFRQIDAELLRLAGEWGCAYTRYADDLAFSGALRFTQEHTAEVASALQRGGFEPNPRKTRIIGSGGRQIVAGVVVNRVAQPPRWKRRLWRAMFHRADTAPDSMQAEAMHLAGIASFVNQYDSALAQSYRQVVQGLMSEQASEEPP